MGIIVDRDQKGGEKEDLPGSSTAVTVVPGYLFSLSMVSITCGQLGSGSR